MSPPNNNTEEGRVKRDPDGVFRFDVEKILKLRPSVNGNNGVYPFEGEVGGVLWRVNAHRKEGLWIGLHCRPSQSTPWSIDFKGEFTLIHSDSTKNLTIEKSGTIQQDEYWTGVEFLEWNDLIGNEKGFIIDEKITVEIRFWISNKKGIKFFPNFDFTDSNDSRHDVAFIFEGEKIYSNKAILASLSPFFNSMFYDDLNENKKEYELKDADRNEFFEMLHVIYPSFKKITDNSVEFLLKLGDRFMIPSLIDRAEKVLIETKEVSNIEKLRISDKYKLIGLQDHCLERLRTLEQFEELKESYFYPDLSDALCRLLFERLLKISNPNRVSHPPRETPKHREERTPDGIIRFEVENISTLTETEYRGSHEIVVNGVHWMAGVWKSSSIPSIDIRCLHDQLSPWEIDVDAEFSLVHPDGSKKFTAEEWSTVTANSEDCWFGTSLMDTEGFQFESDDEIWQKFINNEEGFIVDDKITVEVHFWITDMRGIKTSPSIDFTDANDPRHDVTLMIEGEKIYASKAVLAAHSPFFNSLFFGEFSEKNKDEIELKDVDRKEFLEMLYAINPPYKQITEESADYLIKLGDRFQIAGLIDRAEKALINVIWPTPNTLRIADKYQLYGLKEHCLSRLSYQSTKVIMDIKESSIYDDLSEELVGLLEERLKILK